jgi:O-antigen ligase
MPPTLPPTRASAWAWAQTAALSANLAWTTLCLGGYRPETMVVSGPLILLLVVANLLGRAAAPSTDAPRLHPAGWLFLPFLAYAAANVHWITPVRWLGWADWLGWAQMIAMFWLALNLTRAPGPRRLIWIIAAALGAIGVGMAVWQRFFDPGWLMLGRTQNPYFLGRASGSFGIPNSFAAMLLLLIPPAIALAADRAAPPRRRFVAATLATLWTFGLALTISRGAWLSLGAALACWPLLRPERRWPRKLAAAALAAAAMIAVGAAFVALVPAAKARFSLLATQTGELTRPIMWRISWSLFRESPVLGTGAGSYAVRGEEFRPEGFKDALRWPHNDYLNTLSDYGAIGFGLFFGAVALLPGLARRARRNDPNPADRATDGWESPAVTRALSVGLIAFGLATLVDFHLKIPALALLAALALGEWTRRRWPVRASLAPPTFGHRIGLGLAAVAVAGVALGFAWPIYRAEALRYQVRREIDRLAAAPTLDETALGAILATAPAALAQATAIDPDNAMAWSDLAYVDALHVLQGLAAPEPAGQAAEEAASRALSLSEAVPEFWVRLGVAQDLQGLWADAGPNFAQAIRLAPNNGLMWFHQAWHWSLQPFGLPLAQAALDTSLQLDPGNKSAQLLRQQLAARP